jgi:hypothetical protein
MLCVEEAFAIDPRILRVIIVMTLVTLPLKAVALWRAARAEQKGWYIALMLINTLGLLDLTYLFYFAKHNKAKSHQQQ